jgi:hypothetical protein
MAYDLKNFSQTAHGRSHFVNEALVAILQSYDNYYWSISFRSDETEIG